MTYYPEEPVELAYYPDPVRAAWASDNGYGHLRMIYSEAQEFFNSHAGQMADRPARLSCDCCRDRHRWAKPKYQPLSPVANFCTTCGLDFSTEFGFDAHLAGTYETGRYCMSTDELEQAGWTEDRYGRWKQPAEKPEPLVARVSL
jgi:hypothetical protein